MQEYIEAGDAGWSIRQNTIIQAVTREGYWKTGGKITPGTSATAVTVAVATGTATVNGTPAEWAGAELTLADGGVGPSGTDKNDPRVDTIYAKENGTLAVATGQPAPYAPDTTLDGQAYQPAPFEHWSPSPDAGSAVGGVPLGFVLVPPNATDANDIPDTHIRQWKIEGTELTPTQAAALIESYDTDANGPLETTVRDSRQFAGQSQEQFRERTWSISATVPKSTTEQYFINAPQGLDHSIRRYGFVQNGGDSPAAVRIQISAADGTLLSTLTDGTGTGSTGGYGQTGGTLNVKFINESGTNASGYVHGVFIG